MTQRQRITALHEAGHAAVSWAFDGFVDSASVIPNEQGGSYGHVRILPGQMRAVARAAGYGRTDADRQLVMKELLNMAAGPVAGCIGGGGLVRSYPFPWETWGGGADRDQAERLFQVAGDLLYVNSLDDIVEEATDLIQEPRTWNAIERLADSLQRWGTLDYREIEFALTTGY
jgi:hypothetical protein